MQRPGGILIAGPTASGKSQLALDLAEQFDGEIINTDSMQVYPVLRVLTARPDVEDTNRVPHHLYGHATVDKPYSVAKWLSDVEPVLADVMARGKVPVFVGGTGLYFMALQGGLAPVPDIPAALRAGIRADLIEQGPEVLHERLKKLDVTAAEKLKPNDGHRIARALEVMMATGKPLADFHEAPDQPGLLAGMNVDRILLMPERAVLHMRINRRSEQMLESSAIDEVKALLALELPVEATVLRAIGVPQIKSMVLGEQSIIDATERLKAATRQYAKRQMTWFRNQFDDDWHKIS